MEKLSSSFKNMFLVLMGIALVAGASLGSVYNVTKQPIEAAKLAKQLNAIQQVVPGFTNKPSEEAITIDVDGESVVIYPATKDGEAIGAAVETFTKGGFSGIIKLMVGFDKEGNVINYSVLEHKETPGLGSKMDEWFRSDKAYILGKNPSSGKLTVKKDGGEVDAITAATISSRAFLDAVNRGHKVYMENLGSNSGQNN